MKFSERISAALRMRRELRILLPTLVVSLVAAFFVFVRFFGAEVRALAVAAPVAVLVALLVMVSSLSRAAEEQRVAPLDRNEAARRARALVVSSLPLLAAVVIILYALARNEWSLVLPTLAVAWLLWFALNRLLR